MTINIIDKRGRFVDVVYEKKGSYVFYLSLWRSDLYCLNAGYGTVLKFVNESNKWVLKTEVALIGHASFLHNDRLFIGEAGLYVSSRYNACLSLHNAFSGKLIHSYIHKLRSGELIQNPKVCGVDSQGTALFLDPEDVNKPLQLCDSVGTLSVLSWDESHEIIDSPVDAVIDPSDNTLWIININTLYKFIPYYSNIKKIILCLYNYILCFV